MDSLPKKEMKRDNEKKRGVVPRDIWLCIHDHCDIPVKRKLEEALRWPVVGIKKIQIHDYPDLCIIKGKHVSKSLYFHHVTLPLGPERSYNLTFHFSFYSWRKSPTSHRWYRHCPRYDYPTIAGLISIYNRHGIVMLLTHHSSITIDPNTKKISFHEMELGQYHCTTYRYSE